MTLRPTWSKTPARDVQRAWSAAAPAWARRPSTTQSRTATRPQGTPAVVSCVFYLKIRMVRDGGMTAV